MAMLAALRDQRGSARAIGATGVNFTVSLLLLQVQGKRVLGLEHLMQLGALAAGHSLG